MATVRGDSRRASLARLRVEGTYGRKNHRRGGRLMVGACRGGKAILGRNQARLLCAPSNPMRSGRPARTAPCARPIGGGPHAPLHPSRSTDKAVGVAARLMRSHVRRTVRALESITLPKLFPEETVLLLRPPIAPRSTATLAAPAPASSSRIGVVARVPGTARPMGRYRISCRTTRPASKLIDKPGGL